MGILQSDSSPVAMALLWDLYHYQVDAWARLKSSLDRRQITPIQRMLLDQLLSLSQLASLEEVAVRFGELPPDLHRCFHEFHSAPT